MGGRVAGRLVPVVLILGLAACGGGPPRSPVCAAEDALRGALRAVDAARTAEASGDATAVGRSMDEVARLIRVARGNLTGAEANPATGAAARAMLEASNYLEFMVGDFRSSGRVDFTLTQFAARELDRAVAGAGGAPINC